MQAADSLSGRPHQHEDAGLSDLRQAALQRSLGLFLVVAFAILLLDGVYITSIDVGPSYLALALVALVGVAYRCLRLGLALASIVLTVGLVGVICLAELILPSAPSAAALCIPILVATVL